jgi:15-cis-phytoene synthase
MVHGAIDPDVRGVYRRCAALQLRRDPTFFIATRRLPGDVRPAVHALYGFVRGADDIVDAPGAGAVRRDRLDAWQAELERGLTAGRSDHPIIGALVHAGQRYDLPLGELRVYMDSMRVDCDRVRMADRAALDAYMNGSAAAVGRIMAPLLGAPEADRETVAALGVAFQLTNFIRDVREDLELDRVYLPEADRHRFGVDEADLAKSSACSELRALIASEVARARALFAGAQTAIAATPGSVRPGIRLACSVYGRVLDRVEAVDFDVLGRRTSVRAWELPGVAVGALRR